MVKNAKIEKFKCDILGDFQTLCQGEHWRKIRNLVTPLFTSSKLKSIMPLLHKNADKLVKHLEIKSKSTDPDLDCKDVFQRLTIENLGNLGCGFEANVINEDEKNIFYRQAMILSGSSAPPVSTILRFIFLLLFPNLAYYLRVDNLEKNSFNFFVDIVKKSIKERRENNYRRNDFIDLMEDTLKESSEIGNVQL